MNQTILMGKEQVITLTVTGDVSAETLSFVVSESFGGSAVITKSGASIDADFKSPYTFVKVTILQADTAGLYAGHKFYSLSGNNGVLLQGSVYFQAVASNPYDPTLGYDLRTVRVLAIPASDFNTGDFLQVQEVDGEKAFVNLTTTEMRTALDVAKVQAGTATDLYLKWNNSTSKWENRTLAEIQGDLGIDSSVFFGDTVHTLAEGQEQALGTPTGTGSGYYIVNAFDPIEGAGGLFVAYYSNGQLDVNYIGNEIFSSSNISYDNPDVKFSNTSGNSIVITYKSYTQTLNT